MDLSELISIMCRLILGAVASFLAIMLWPRTRDVAWILIIVGTITAYVETVFSILRFFGMDGGNFLSGAALSFLNILLPSLSTAFIVAAFAVMVVRKYRRR